MGTRKESVRLDLEGNFSTQMAQNAAATAWLNRELENLNGSSAAGSRGMANFQRDLRNVDSTNAQTRAGLDQTGSSINQLTGRLGLFADAAIVLGPGLVPIAGAGVVALGGLSAAALGLAVAGGAAVLAFQGVGDAVEAVQAYQLDPTVENLEAARDAMSQLGPDARTFVTEFQKVRPAITAIRDAAAAGLFPGLTDSLDAFERLGPKLEEIAFAAGDATGFVANSAAESLVSDRWQPFLDVLAEEVPEAVGSISRVIGDIAHGISEMMRTFAGDAGFLNWIEKVANGFDDWASSAQAEESLEGIITYVRQNGPELQDLVATLAEAFTAIVKAAAPLAGTALVGLTAVAEVVKLIAESDMATPLLAGVAALRLFNRLQAVTVATSARMTTMRATPPVPAAPAITAAQTAYLNGLPAHLRDPLARGRASDVRAAQEAQRAANRRMLAGGAAGAGAMALLASGTAEEMGATNAAMGALIGSMMGPWGAAVGVAGGGFLDIMANAKQTEEALDSFNNVLASGTTNFADYEAASAAMRQKQEDYYSNFDTTGSATSFLLKNPAETYNLLGDALDGNVERFGAYAKAAGDAESTTVQMGRNFMWVAQQMGDTEPITAADLVAPDAERVQKTIDDLGPSLSKMGYSLEEVSAMTPQELGTFVADLQSLNGQLFDSNSLLRGFVASLAEAQGFLSGRADMRAYEASIDDATRALKNNGRTLDQNRRKGRDNAAALDAIATSGLKIAESLKGAERRQFLRGLREQLVTTGRAFGQNRQQSLRFLDGLNLVDAGVVNLRQELNALPKDVRTRVRNEGVPKSIAEAKRWARELDLSAKDREALLKMVPKGQGEIAAAKRLMDSVNSKTVTLTVQRVSRSANNNNVVVDNTGADGATVPKTGLPYADRHLYMLADGEEVISNRHGQADRFRADRSAGRIPGYADGGTTGWGTYMPSTPAAPRGDATWPVFRESERTARGLKALQRELKASESALASEKDQRRALVDQVRSNFMTDPFAKPDSIWASGGSPIAALQGDIGNLRRFDTIINRLEKRGLNGGALREADTLEEAQALAGMSRGELRRYEQLYNRRQRLAGSVGGAYATAVTGTTPADIDRMVKKLERIEAAIKRESREDRKNRNENTDRAAEATRASARAAAIRRRMNGD